MTMRKTIFLAVAAVVITAMSACGFSDGAKGKPSGNEGATDTTQCRFSNIREACRMQYVDTDGDTCYIDNTVSILWPEIINGKPCDTLQVALRAELVDSTGINTIDQVVKCLLESNYPDGPEKSTLKAVTAITGDEPRISSNNVRLQLKELGERLLTYHIYYDSYAAGGAHGIYANRYVTYDLKLDKVVTFEDIIADTTLLRTAILRSIKREYDYDKDDLFIPDSGLLPLPGDFCIDGGVLHAVYQVYDIASYAQGAIDAPIYPYQLKPEEMKRLFTPYGLELIDYSD